MLAQSTTADFALGSPTSSPSSSSSPPSHSSVVVVGDQPRWSSRVAATTQWTTSSITRCTSTRRPQSTICSITIKPAASEIIATSRPNLFAFNTRFAHSKMHPFRFARLLAGRRFFTCCEHRVDCEHFRCKIIMSHSLPFVFCFQVPSLMVKLFFAPATAAARLLPYAGAGASRRPLMANNQLMPSDFSPACSP